MKAALISLGSISSKWTVAAMRRYFEQVDAIQLKNIDVVTNSGIDVFYNGKPLPSYDCVYVKGSFRYAPVLRSVTAALHKKCYMPLRPETFDVGHDKLITHLALQQHRIPMPKTYIASTASAAKKVLESVNYPVVYKLPQGTGGKGVMFADSFAAASSLLDTLIKLNQPFIIQEYVETGGVDIRAFVIGDKLAAAYKRKAVSGEKRANIHSGGKGEPYEASREVKKIAVQTAQSIGADICAVDILESAKGPAVIEVNLSPGLQGITRTTKIDIADKIAKFLFDKTTDFVKQRKGLDAAKVMDELAVEKGQKKEIFTNLDFRGERILLPEIVSKLTKFSEKDDVVISADEKELSIKRINIK
jgi:ribosomal protein S6--L-glutamate ligase